MGRIKLKQLTGCIAGSKFQYDLRSKALAVEAIIKHDTPYEELAELYGVRTITVKYWHNRYATTYQALKQIEAGIMRTSSTVFTGRGITQAKELLATQESQRLAFMEAIGIHTSFHNRQI